MINISINCDISAIKLTKSIPQMLDEFRSLNLTPAPDTDMWRWLCFFSKQIFVKYLLMSPRGILYIVCNHINRHVTYDIYHIISISYTNIYWREGFSLLPHFKIFQLGQMYYHGLWKVTLPTSGDDPHFEGDHAKCSTECSRPFSGGLRFSEPIISTVIWFYRRITANF